MLLTCSQAIPILNDALSALDTIKEADIAYIKKLANPPSAIKLVMEAVCVVLDVKPVKVGCRIGFEACIPCWGLAPARVPDM